jgi:hypothetical protein
MDLDLGARIPDGGRASSCNLQGLSQQMEPTAEPSSTPAQGPEAAGTPLPQPAVPVQPPAAQQPAAAVKVKATSSLVR